jgi:hypothetical protein
MEHTAGKFTAYRDKQDGLDKIPHSAAGLIPGILNILAGKGLKKFAGKD